MKKTLSSFLFMLIGIFVITSCKKEDINNQFKQNDPSQNSPIGSGINISTNISGVVLDQNNLPVQFATVQIGNIITHSDHNGVFKFINVLVDSERAYIKVSKTGFFDGSKIINTIENQHIITRIKLIPRVVQGTISNSTGGSVNVNGAEVNFDPGDVSYEDGTPFIGIVNVHMAYLDPSSEEMLNIMPGDLAGIDQNGEHVILQSYGMIVIELTDSNGESLNITPGQTVGLTIPIDASHLTHAPLTMPLWYFDETNGNWIEEGHGTLQGNKYVGEVSHFTYWNYDFPYPPISIEGSFECNGNPLQGVEVIISSSNDNSFFISTFTNSSGIIQGYVPAGMDLNVEVLSNCGNSIYSQSLISGSVNLNLGTISFCDPLSTSTLNTTLLDCYGSPITNGAAYIFQENSWFPKILYPDQNGSISTTLNLCQSDSITIIAYDYDNNQNTGDIRIPVLPVINLDSISTCASSDEYILYNIDGQIFELYNDVNGWARVDFSINGGDTIEFLCSSYGLNDYGIWFITEAATTGTFTGSYLTVRINGINHQTGPINTFDVTFTTMASGVGQLVEGSFGGTYLDNQQNTRTINGTFRLRAQ